jgi:hypothetical protein
MKLLPTKILSNCYTQSTLDLIKKLFKDQGVTSPCVHEWPGPHYGKTVSVKQKLTLNEHSDLQQLVFSGLPAELTQWMIVMESSHLQSFIPYEVHCDCGWLDLQTDESPFYVVIIPLETYNARTISFNQLGHDLHFVDYKKDNPPLPSDQCVSETEFDQYFSHCWPQERSYISIDTVFEWQAGSVFMFDARRFHASDNYTINGVTEKNCVILMTKIQQQNLQALDQTVYG